jgi:4-amino-4-deoxy-L-arabinose transferase-like glycosyltransferase
MEKVAHFFSFKTAKNVWLSRESISIFLILILGAFLRIYKIRDYLVFLGDEGRDVLVVWGILHGDLTFLGPTSSVGGFFLGPFYYYLMAPFLWLSRFDPVGPAIMVAIIGVITIFLVYYVGKELFNAKAGLIAALLYAISPIVIIYSRSSWNPNVFPFFTLLSLFCLYKAITTDKWWLFALTGLLMGLNLQIHYLATFVGAIIFFYVFFVDFKLSKSWIILTIKRYLLLFCGFLVGFSLFIAFEVRHNFTNSFNILNFIFNSKDTGLSGNIFKNIEFVFERLFGGLILSFPLSRNFAIYNFNLLIAWRLVGILIGLISIGFFLYLFKKNYKDKKIYKKYLLILIWLIVGIGLFLFYKKPVYDYYLGFLFPVPFLLVGLLFSGIWDKYIKLGVFIVIASLILIVSVNLKFSPILKPANQQANQVKAISDFVLSKTNGQPFNFALMTAGNSDHAYRYFFKLADRDPIVIENSEIDPERKTVTDQLMIICEKSVPCKPLGYPLWEVAGFGRAEIKGEWDVPFVKVFRLKHFEEPKRRY